MINKNGLVFEERPNSSDLKTIKEVIDRNVYQRRTMNFFIERGEHWLDLGANVGAFSCLALSKGAFVTAYEPDPANVKQLKKNLALNHVSCDIHSVAIVHDDRSQVTLNLWPQGQSWRNSIVRNKRGTTPLIVPCFNFFKIAAPSDCVKMDIEGAEIELLERWPSNFKVKKLVFEYSFDADPNVQRLRNILLRLSALFELQYAKQIQTIERWNFFPPCTMVFCKLKSSQEALWPFPT